MTSLERMSGGSSVIDVLDRVLDKGIVIDAWVRVSLIGIELVTVQARVVVASIATHLDSSDVPRPHTPRPISTDLSARPHLGGSPA